MPSEFVREDNHRRPIWPTKRDLAAAATHLKGRNKVPTHLYKEREYTAEGFEVLRAESASSSSLGLFSSRKTSYFFMKDLLDHPRSI